MKLVVILSLFFTSAFAFAETQYTLVERLELLLPGNEKKYAEYRADLYNSKYQSAHQKLTPLFKAWLDYYETGNDLYLNRAIILADQLTQDLRYMSSHRNYGDLEELTTIAVVAYFEFFRDFKSFTHSRYAIDQYDYFEILNFKTISSNFNRIYFEELGQPKN